MKRAAALGAVALAGAYGSGPKRLRRWRAALPVRGASQITVTADNRVVVQSGPLLHLLSPEGKTLLKRRVSGDPKKRFQAPVANGADGRLYIASSKRLYCYR